ncbi:DUF547 domain-containing protein [Paraglaciecola hydrolytica]|uniref:DUF547 domain-containing protein n=1 Tax=Paraglaciecola hydrolytica TaxID=1799789 RepID=A0A135ZZ59_9ALTE|nr:DUF547 domain-containing protein [Paraglaciecola hydrolytica]KXI28261.1 hypothetical protein AX660_17955 [Paraglaciecola hydrolytica]
MTLLFSSLFTSSLFTNKGKKVSVLVLSFCLFFKIQANEANIPESFKGDTPSSSYTIKYNDIDLLFNSLVMATGMSDRKKTKGDQAEMGSRLKININRLSASEANRFYFEALETDEQRAVITNIRKNLEKLPDTAPLQYFHKSEQLAYWLNLYNITMIEQLIKLYPQKDLEDEFVGKDSILDKKLLKVSGIELSFNDIQHKILMPKFDNDPLIIYGLYQGFIGGPNIRPEAYKGDSVFQSLKDNAYEFVNSNRGTYAERRNVFRVSSLYERNKNYFPNFEADLVKHLHEYLIGEMHQSLDDSTKIRTNINNWDITDIYGSLRKSGNSAMTSEAALLDAVVGNADNGGTMVSLNAISNMYADIAQSSLSRFSPEQLAQIQALSFKRAQNAGYVEVTDFDTPSRVEKNN